MAGHYTGSYLDQCSGWRAVTTVADIGQASLVGGTGGTWGKCPQKIPRGANSDMETGRLCRHVPVWRPSSFTQYVNGRTASREENFPTPVVGGLGDDRRK
jgi:hypothetical protein